MDHPGSHAAREELRLGHGPWLYGRSGRHRLIQRRGNLLDSDPPPAVLVASRSRDRGRNWSPVVPFAGPSLRVEREVITADPTRPGHAYVVWWERDPLMEFVGSTHQFARTTDGGASWSTPTTLDTAPPGALDQSAEIHVLPNVSLLATFPVQDRRHVACRSCSSRAVARPNLVCSGGGDPQSIPLYLARNRSTAEQGRLT